MSEELVIFARFHALQGKEEAVASELRDTVARTALNPVAFPSKRTAPYETRVYFGLTLAGPMRRHLIPTPPFRQPINSSNAPSVSLIIHSTSRARDCSNKSHDAKCSAPQPIPGLQSTTAPDCHVPTRRRQPRN